MPEKVTVNYPVDKTVLANEQVENGKDGGQGPKLKARADTMVFYLRLRTRIIGKLDNLPNWPEKVKTMQKN